jgi:hypothetical protein
MAARRYRHTRGGAVKGSENGVRPEGNYLQREVRRAGTSNLGGKRRQARHGLGTQISDRKKWNDMFRLIAENGRVGTRQAAGSHGLSVQYARTDSRKYLFAVRTMEKWNNSPDIKSALNGEVFKNRMAKLKATSGT